MAAGPIGIESLVRTTLPASVSACTHQLATKLSIILSNRRGLTVVALENAVVHVGGAAIACGDGQGVASHIDLAGNIDSCIRARGKLSPGLVDLSVRTQTSTADIDASETTTHGIDHRDGNTGTGRQ